MKTLLVAVVTAVLCTQDQQAHEPPKATGKQQFMYVLKLVPRLLDEKNWTEQDRQIVTRHVQSIELLQSEGKLILAGRTTAREPMGIVIFEAKDETEAKTIMERDAAVKEQIMTATVQPFAVVFQRK